MALAAATFSGCIGDRDPSASLAGAVPDLTAGDAPVAVIEVPEESAPYVVGEEILFDGSASRGAIRFWAWSFGDHQTLVDTDPTARHAYSEGGEFTVVLLVRDALGRDAFDVFRVSVVDPNAPAVAAAPAASHEPTYVWDPPKYAREAFESMSLSTLPVAGAPYALGAAVTFLHVDFVPDDAGMLLDGLVVYQDHLGQNVCPGANAQVTEWTYDGQGRYHGLAEDCGQRVGVARQVYVGVCVEFDGELRPPGSWTRVENVIFGDRQDECWQRVQTLP